MKNEFSIEICSDLDHEGMVVDLYYKSARIITLAYDEELDKAEVFFLDNETDTSKFHVNYKDFIDVLDLAFEKLKKVNNKD